jgi:uncharacterized iron-regulated protein
MVGGMSRPIAQLMLLFPALALACSPGADADTDTDPSESTGGSEASDSTATDTATPTSTGTDPGTSGESSGTTGDTAGGQSWPDPEDAPQYPGDAFAAMQIYDVAAEVWLDEQALMTGLEPAQVVFVGEQHEVPAIHELQLWVLERVLAADAAVGLGMEHFQRDEQSVIDDYLAGTIDAAAFEAAAQPWAGYAKHWKPLVEAMKAAGRPVLALNVPDEALDKVYAAFPERPLDIVNGWGDGAPFVADLPPRPLAPWSADYQGYFAGSYDYNTHGKDWGLSYEEALDYFTDLALIRDDTMGWWISEHVTTTGDRLVVVAGDWHVQTGLATPDSASKFAELTARRITTATPGTLAAVLGQGFAGRPVADYVLVYTPQ